MTRRRVLDGPGQIGRLRRGALAVSVGLGATMSAIGEALPADAAPYSLQPNADAALFALTNQDRASNGLRSLVSNPTLHGVGTDHPYTACGFAVAGRSADMIQRNYFAHPIPPCGIYVFVLMQEAGIHYQSAGENIGWDSGISDGASSANYINTQFMNSPEHRANILNPNYTDLGIGTVQTAGNSTWSGSGPAYSGVWMFSEEFAQLAATPPGPPPTAPPATLPPRNSSAPPPPAVTPIQTPALPQPPPVRSLAPSPTSTSQASPNPSTTAPTSSDENVPSPLTTQSSGLLSGSVESVLEAYLIG